MECVQTVTWEKNWANQVFFGYGDTLVLRTGLGKLGATREPRPSHPLQPLLCHSRLLGALPFPSFGGSPPRQGKAHLFVMSVGASVAGAAPSPCPCCPAAPLSGAMGQSWAFRFCAFSGFPPSPLPIELLCHVQLICCSPGSLPPQPSSPGSHVLRSYLPWPAWPAVAVQYFTRREYG